MGSPSEWCRWLSDRQRFAWSDPTDSSHSETKVWTDVGRGSGWTGSTKSLRNAAYGCLKGLGCGCRRVVCTSSPLVCGLGMDRVGHTSSACSAFSSSTLGCCVSVRVNRALFTGNGSRSVASSRLFRVGSGVASPAGSPLSGDCFRRVRGRSVPDGLTSLPGLRGYQYAHLQC